MAGDSVIRTQGLSKRFGSKQAVLEVDMAVTAGEVHGLLGPNGAGKTTVIRLLLGLIRPSAGTAEVFGLDGWRQRRQIHRRIGVLPSDFAYEESLTGRQVIDFFTRLRTHGTPDAGALKVEQQGRVERLAERLRADLDRPQKQLSRGNQLKIGLIQALAHDPDLLLLDEPTSGLDPLMQEEFLQIIAELRAAGRTVLLSSHNMAEVERACDRISMIHDGRLMAVETVESMLARSARHLRVTFDGPVPSERIEALPGVTGLKTDGATLEFDVAGELDPVLRALTDGQRVRDLTCERPSLEHAFVRLYEDEDAVQGADGR